MKKNALILGVSSGFGKATALELAKQGYNIYGVHLDLGTNRIKAEEYREELAQYGVKVFFYNINAADQASREETISSIKKLINSGEDEDYIRVFLHSIAFAALGPLVDKDKEKQITQKRLEMSINVMSNSMVYWVQDLFHAGLLKQHSRIFTMSSNGSIHATNQYGPVSMAKASLEALVRQLAFELAPYGITANSILAGPADTPASSKIPDFHKMLSFAREFNPYQRNTVPEDISKVIALLASEDSYWITGQVINVDGGQSLFTYLPEYYANLEK
ncbi:MAG TPA: SDR family oxidoreductase [Candidatus Kapabacteria bacterium]|nr:SDR family oxidoreductase [Candidatus Kapabacteria bacterium]